VGRALIRFRRPARTTPVPASQTRTSGLRRLGKGLSPKPVPISLAGSARPVNPLSASGRNLALRGGPDGRLACEPFCDFRRPSSELDAARAHPCRGRDHVAIP
jgi:hypothetical protein